MEEVGLGIREPISDVADRLATSTLEVERIVRYGVADADGNLGLFRVGRVLERVPGIRSIAGSLIISAVRE